MDILLQNLGLLAPPVREGILGINKKSSKKTKKGLHGFNKPLESSLVSAVKSL